MILGGLEDALKITDPIGHGNHQLLSLGRGLGTLVERGMETKWTESENDTSDLQGVRLGYSV